MADEYPHDAQHIPDEEWIRHGCRAGWVLLSKDKRIRYRGPELAELHHGRLFCLSSGNLVIAEMVRRFELAARPIVRFSGSDRPGFWMVYDGGEVRQKWP